jgi:hypothetical protein
MAILWIKHPGRLRMTDADIAMAINVALVTDAPPVTRAA